MATQKRVIIKRPDEDYGHVTNISFDLENLQKTVGGPIEVVSLGKSLLGEPIMMIINEEGKIRDLPFNFMIGARIAPSGGFDISPAGGFGTMPVTITSPFQGELCSDYIVGTAIICGMGGPYELGELPITFQEWKRILDKIRGCA